MMSLSLISAPEERGMNVVEDPCLDRIAAKLLLCIVSFRLINSNCTWNCVGRTNSTTHSAEIGESWLFKGLYDMSWNLLLYCSRC